MAFTEPFGLPVMTVASSMAQVSPVTSVLDGGGGAGLRIRLERMGCCAVSAVTGGKQRRFLVVRSEHYQASAGGKNSAHCTHTHADAGFHLRE